jgi:hypothetical protein
MTTDELIRTMHEIEHDRKKLCELAVRIEQHGSEMFDHADDGVPSERSISSPLFSAYQRLVEANDELLLAIDRTHRFAHRKGDDE